MDNVKHARNPACPVFRETNVYYAKTVFTERAVHILVSIIVMIIDVTRQPVNAFLAEMDHTLPKTRKSVSTALQIVLSVSHNIHVPYVLMDIKVKLVKTNVLTVKQERNVTKPAGIVMMNVMQVLATRTVTKSANPTVGHVTDKIRPGAKHVQITLTAIVVLNNAQIDVSQVRVMMQMVSVHMDAKMATGANFATLIVPNIVLKMYAINLMGIAL